METNGEDKWPYVGTVTTIFFIVLGLWFLWFFCLDYFSKVYPNHGVLGDWFSTLNTLFSGLAFTGLIYAILLQKSELSLQRRELEQTRKELSGQREQLELQNKKLTIQTFENTFFQLLRSHNDIVAAIDLVKGPRTTRGRDCIRTFFKRYASSRKAEKQYPTMANDVLGKIEQTYLTFYNKHEGELGHYFRSLYNIVKFIHSSKIDEDGKRRYTNLLRAQLSKFELLLLFYNCLSSKGREKFKPLVEQYALLKMLNSTDLVLPDVELGLYLPSAYGYPLPNH